MLKPTKNEHNTPFCHVVFFNANIQWQVVEGKTGLGPSYYPLLKGNINQRYCVIIMKGNSCVKKILLLGPDKSGKTAIASTLCNEQNTLKYTPTIGVSFHTFTFDQTKILLWDCGGLRHFRSLWSLFLSGAHGIIFVIDGTDSFSLVEGLLWVQEMCPTRIPLLIFINKQDLSNAIDPASIQTILSHYGIQVEGGTIFNKKELIEKIQSFLERVPNGLSLENPHKKDYSQETAVFVI